MKYLQENSKSRDFTFDNLSTFVRNILKSEMEAIVNLGKVTLKNKESGYITHFSIRTSKL